MHKRLRSIHRWASLTMMSFWLVQALTGMLLVFSWELDDATVSAPHVPTDLTAIDAALARITAAHPGTRIAAVRTTAGKPDRYDVTLDEGGKTAMLRIDGPGQDRKSTRLNSSH